jgi:hypothetical protein
MPKHLMKMTAARNVDTLMMAMPAAQPMEPRLMNLRIGPNPLNEYFLCESADP